MVAALKMVGEGRWTLEALEEALVAADPSRLSSVAPPEGLYFMEAEY